MGGDLSMPHGLGASRPRGVPAEASATGCDGESLCGATTAVDGLNVFTPCVFKRHGLQVPHTEQSERRSRSIVEQWGNWWDSGRSQRHLVKIQEKQPVLWQCHCSVMPACPFLFQAFAYIHDLDFLLIWSCCS